MTIVTINNGWHAIRYSFDRSMKRRRFSDHGGWFVSTRMITAHSPAMTVDDMKSIDLNSKINQFVVFNRETCVIV